MSTERAVVWRTLHGVWWAEVCDVKDYRPEMSIYMRAPVGYAETRRFATHAEAIDWADWMARG